MKKQTLIIVRGDRSSPKNDVAKSHLSDRRVDRYYDADMFFVDDAGDFVFDHTKQKEADAWCLGCVELALAHGLSVVVGVTFDDPVRVKADYTALALRFGVTNVETIDCVSCVPPHVLPYILNRSLTVAPEID